jgi:competence protein ComEC
LRNKPITAPLLRPAICLIIGITAGRFLSCDVTAILIILLATLVAAFLLRKSDIGQSISISMACILLGGLLCLHQKEQLNVAWPSTACDYSLVIASEPIERGKTLSMDALLADDGRKIQLRIMRDELSEQLTIGDGLLVHAAITPLTAQSSYRTWLETHGYVGETFVTRNRWQREALPLAGIGSVQRARLFFMGIRHRLLQQISTTGIKQEDYSILSAMVLGDKSGVNKEQKEQFSVAGTSHLLALSGLHLGIIYMLLSFLFRDRRWQVVNQLLIVASVWAFVLLVGMPSSVVRAAVMITTLAFIRLLHRGATPLNSLALAALVILITNPYSLFDVGFQLSFCAVLAILLFTPLIESLLTSHHSPFTKYLLSLTIVSIAAQIGTAPLVAYYFGRFSVWFLLANYVAIPLATLILYSMVIALLVSSITSALFIIPATLASWLNGWTAWIASLPFSSIDDLRPTILQTVMIYVIIAGIWYLLHYHVTHNSSISK